MIRHDDFYYLFYSGDNCCGPDAEYGVMVARSRSADRAVRDARASQGVPHSLMLFKSERWLASGPQFDRHRQGRAEWIIYHAIDVNRPRQRQEDEINSRRILLIDRIEWKDGWPFVGTPSDDAAGRPHHLAPIHGAPGGVRLRRQRRTGDRAATCNSSNNRSSTCRLPSAVMVDNRPASAWRELSQPG